MRSPRILRRFGRAVRNCNSMRWHMQISGKASRQLGSDLRHRFCATDSISLSFIFYFCGFAFPPPSSFCLSRSWVLLLLALVFIIAPQSYPCMNRLFVIPYSHPFFRFTLGAVNNPICTFFKTDGLLLWMITGGRPLVESTTMSGIKSLHSP